MHYVLNEKLKNNKVKTFAVVRVETQGIRGIIFDILNIK